MPFLLGLVVLMGLVPTTAVTFRVQDASGVPLKGELVIVQDLGERQHELLRALTDGNGNVPLLDLPPGLYRMIATAPYGLWRTKVREFLVKERPVEIVVRVEPLPTHGNGDIVIVGTISTNLQVLRADGKPASEATVLVRDENATLNLERWYKTNENGIAKIEFVSDPVVLVVVFGDTLLVTEVAEKNLNPVVRLPTS